MFNVNDLFKYKQFISGLPRRFQEDCEFSSFVILSSSLHMIVNYLEVLCFKWQSNDITTRLEQMVTFLQAVLTKSK